MNFDGGKIKKSNFYKNKKLFNIYGTQTLVKYQLLKKNLMVKKAHSNTLECAWI